MSKSLVVVESPAKARTISRFLKNDMTVMASMGHIRDLPQSSLGVDVKHDFTPSYVVTKNGRKVVKQLRDAAKQADAVFLATDPDREGEAIAWHVQEVLKKQNNIDFQRVTFHEITKSAVAASFQHPEQVDRKRVDAQQARRVLDRLVGYQISPLLWKSIQKGTSAGRVQSVALRLVCERERLIQDFVAVEYWNFDALFQPEQAEQSFSARLTLLDGKKPQVDNAAEAEKLAGELEDDKSTFKVLEVDKKPRKKSPAPPFITSTLQQAASSSLRLSTSQTMRLAQQLYEGMEVGTEGATGLITYMRTDSVSISSEAQAQTRSYIAERYGSDYVPAKPRVYRSKQSAQEAHEAIRPTDIQHTPEAVAQYLNQSQLKLYRLIWNRFVASQMSAAEYLDHTVDVGAEGRALTHDYIFRAKASKVTFPGYLAVYNVREPDEETDENEGNVLPELSQGLACALLELQREQKFTEPPKRFSEATLVRELEQNGVGRPSTYASIVNTIQQRDYTQKQKGRLVPTTLGFRVNDFLVSNIPDLFEVEFTAKMESQLDDIEEGKTDWRTMLSDFYTHFEEWLQASPVAAAPKGEAIQRLLSVFPEKIAWEPPAKKGRRVYDDKKFFDSLKKQVEEQGRLSDRQWNALLALAARYAAQLPELEQKAEELGLLSKIQQLIQESEKQAESPVEPDAADRELVAVLANVQWTAPVKRGRRTYDDSKFYSSLNEQVENGRKLSPAQQESLKKLIAKYQQQIDNFDTLSQKYDIEKPEQPSEAEKQQIRELLALSAQIKEWQEPKKRGKRVYDDQEFANSLRTQFDSKGMLSKRQLAAFSKLLARYADQIDGYKEKAKALELPAAAGKPEKVDAKCPECGADLLKRHGRGRIFYGCSTFPKCRFTTNELNAD